MATETRPKYLNLFKIRLPLTGVVSILHRGTGVLMILALPVVIFLFEQSLASPKGFLFVAQFIENPVTLIVAISLVWALSHHFFAGFRFLLFDLDISINKSSARRAAILVFIASLLLTAFVVAWWFR